MTEHQDSYPHGDVGPPARPPAAPEPKVMAMAREARRRELGALGLGGPPPDLFGLAGDWRLAASLVVLGDEANLANPGRDKSSDGTIGDDRHQALGSKSDHNPWLVWQGTPWVRARDIDTSGLDVAAAFERARHLAHTGHLPQVRNGGYLIAFGRITAHDFSRWHVYKGANPHILAGHVSVSTEPARFDDRRPWGIFAPAAAPEPAPAPGPPPPPAGPGWTGPDLRGSGLDLRGEEGANGPRVKALQGFLRANYPLYAKGLDVDGWWGAQTRGVVREFGRRTGVLSADGANIGPQLARKLFLAGFRG